MWQIIFEVDFTTNPGADPTSWTDLSDRMTGAVDISFGAGRLSGGGEGSATLTLDNTDRLIDPTNPDATLNLIPLRHARVRAIVDTVEYQLFRGLVDAWPPSWSGFDSLVQVRLVDGFAWLGLQSADIDLPRQMSDVRIGAILDLAEWPAGRRDIATGVVELEPLEQGSANLLSALQDAAEAEGGDLYVAPDGKITFRSRHASLGTTTSVTFGEGGVAFSSVEPAWDTAWLTNIGRVELADGDVYESIDTVSRDKYGPRVFPVRDLALRAAEAEAVAQWEVVRFAEEHVWLDRLLVEACETGTLATLLPLRPGDRAAVAHVPPYGGAVNLDMNIERVHYMVEATAWACEFDLSPFFGAGPWLTLDDPVLGLLDGDNKLAP